MFCTFGLTNIIIKQTNNLPVELFKHFSEQNSPVPAYAKQKNKNNKQSSFAA